MFKQRLIFKMVVAATVIHIALLCIKVLNENKIKKVSPKPLDIVLLDNEPQPQVTEEVFKPLARSFTGIANSSVNILPQANANSKPKSQSSYLKEVEQYIETYGNNNFAATIHALKLHGSCQLQVTIKPDGNISRIEVLNSSGNSKIDAAAKKIVMNAAPFKPFPKKLSELNEINLVRILEFNSNA